MKAKIDVVLPGTRTGENLEQLYKQELIHLLSLSDESIPSFFEKQFKDFDPIYDNESTLVNDERNERLELRYYAAHEGSTGYLFIMNYAMNDSFDEGMVFRKDTRPIDATGMYRC